MRAWLLVLACSACSSRATTSSESPPSDNRPRYEGRVIAGVCGDTAWLERADREAREQPERVLDMLDIREGMTVADVGAGTGYFTVRLARRVGPAGEVLATELQPEMLRAIDTRLQDERITNVRLVRATESQAKLPERCCDLVLLVDVYHELADPPGVMAGIRRALKPTGKLAVVEYKAEDPRIPIKPEHKMTLAQIKKELVPLGFAFVESREELPDQRVVIFTRDDAM